MALTQITFLNLGLRIPVVVNSSFGVSEDITPSGVNQQSATSTKQFVRVATDTKIFIAIGQNPNALTQTTSRLLMMADSVEYFEVSQFADKVAVVIAP